MTQEPDEPAGRHAEEPQPGDQQLPPAPNPGAQQPAPNQQWGQAPLWGQAPQWGQYAPPPGPPQSGWPQQPFPAYQQYVAPPKPGVIPLRPLSLGEILDGAFQSARRNGKAMFGSALLVQAFSAVLTVVLLAVFFSRRVSFLSLVDGTASESQIASFAVSAGATVLIAVLLQTLAQMILQGVLVVPVSRAVLNRTTTFKQMWSLARRRIGSLIGLSLLYMLGSGVVIAVVVLFAVLLVTTLGVGGVLLTIVPVLAMIAGFVWIGTKLLVAPASMIVENLGIFPAIARSWRLTSNNWWRIFGIWIVVILVVGAITGGISTAVSFVIGIVGMLINASPTDEQLILQAVVGQAVSLIVTSVIGAVALAFESGVLALIYVDLRMRTEGFDVMLMKEHEGGPGSDPDGIPGGAPAAGTWPAAPK